MKKIFLLLSVFISFISSAQISGGVKTGLYPRYDSIGIGAKQGRIYVRTDTLRYRNVAGTEFTIGLGGGSGITALSQASDANISSPTNLQLLQYLTSDNKWHNATIDFSRLTIYPCKYATTAALPTNTYDNGTSGVTAQITASANGALVVDANTVLTGDTLLIKDEATASHNGIYRVDQAGNGGAPFIITRVTYFDQSAEILTGSTTFITNGTANANRTYTMNTPGTITVGTTDITWIQTGGASGGGGIADPGANGILVRTALNTTVNRSITGVTNELSVSQGDGVAGNPSIGFASTVDLTGHATTLQDNNLLIQDNTTTSKKIQFQISALTAATTRTWTAPDADITVVGEGNTATLTNKTINLASNTLVSTLSQLSGAVSDDDVVGTTTAQTVTGKRITKRAPTVTQSATPTINTDLTDVAHITGLAQNITSMTTGLSGTPTEGDVLRIDITDNGTARTIAWGTSFEASTVPLPTTTVISTRLDMLFVWNSVSNKWRILAAQ